MGACIPLQSELPSSLLTWPCVSLSSIICALRGHPHIPISQWSRASPQANAAAVSAKAGVLSPICFSACSSGVKTAFQKICPWAVYAELLGEVCSLWCVWNPLWGTAYREAPTQQLWQTSFCRAVSYSWLFSVIKSLRVPAEAGTLFHSPALQSIACWIRLAKRNSSGKEECSLPS